MKADDLKNIRKLRREVRSLELLIKDISRGVVEDVVTGSSPSFPYSKHKIVIRGTDEKRIHSAQLKLIRKRNKLRRAIEEAEEYLETISDPVDRNILRLRCELGMDWKDVASEMNSTEGACKMRFSRMMKEMEDK